ncbi:MAG: RluA family pseudouridine synthase [Kiloniellales bacterium]
MNQGAARHDAVDSEGAGQRLDRWLRKRYPGVPQALLQRLLRSGQIRVDGSRAKADTRLVEGQQVRLPPRFQQAEPDRSSPPPDPQALQRLRDGLLFEDDWVLALNKPAGLAVQGGTGQSLSLDRIAAGLVAAGEPAPRLVHRLDRDTSGVLLMAKRASAARALASSFEGRTARKLYFALVQGVPKRRAGRIDKALIKAGGDGQEKMRTDPEGQAAETLYAVAATAGTRAALVVVAPLTGRTHQIRAHLAAIGHPILGDSKYGATKGPKGSATGLMLHAAELAVPHPEDETTLRIAAPPPADFVEACKRMGLDLGRVEAARSQLEARGA